MFHVFLTNFVIIDANYFIIMCSFGMIVYLKYNSNCLFTIEIYHFSHFFSNQLRPLFTDYQLSIEC